MSFVRCETRATPQFFTKLFSLRQEQLLSSADTKWKLEVDNRKLRFDERPPATPSLILQKVDGSAFG